MALSQDELKLYGPLKHLIGIWEGAKGDDTSPDDDRTQTEKNSYRERIVCEPIGMVNNHEQTLYGLRYSTMAWRIGEPNPFHEEVGYFLWDERAGQIMRTFIVPRGISVIAGGGAKPNDTQFKVSAKLGSATYGICSNEFLDREFRTVAYHYEFKSLGSDSIQYESDTVIQIKDQKELFHHTDKNTLKRVKA